MKFVIFAAFTICCLTLTACKTTQVSKIDKGSKVIQKQVKCGHCAGENIASNKKCKWCGAPLEED